MIPAIPVKTAVVLSGGGATGAYEVGVLKALCEGKSPATGFEPLIPDIFSGTSIGSYNAAVMVSHLPEKGPEAVEYLEHIWIDVIPRDGSTDHNHVFRFRADPLEFLRAETMTRNPLGPVRAFAGDATFLARDWLRRGTQFLRSREPLERRTLELVDISSLISNEPEARLIRDTIRPASLLESPKLLKMAATNWDTGELAVFTNHMGNDSSETLLEEGVVRRAIMASTAIPGLFPAVELGGAHFVDGFVIMNTPLTPAVRAGADTLHLIYLDPNVKNIPLTTLESTLDTMSRVLVTEFASKMNADIEAARRINRELTALERFRERNSEEGPGVNGKVDELANELLGSGNRSFQKLLIHRYHPHDDVSGMLGMLNFNQDRIAGLIERGYRDAIGHDCRASQCVMRDGTYAAEPSAEPVTEPSRTQAGMSASGAVQSGI